MAGNMTYSKAVQFDIEDDIESEHSFRWASDRFCSKQALLLWFWYTTIVFSFWSFEAAILPIGGSKGSDWSKRELYGIFTFIGVIYVLSFSFNKWLMNKLHITKEKRIIGSLLLMTVGCLWLTPFTNSIDISPWQVIIASPFLTSGFCVATIQISSMYCKLVGHTVGDLGVRMSWFFAFASFGFLSGPVYGYLLIRHFGTVNFVSHT
ncbi:hypothetical protein RFI_04614 [Reticulomyxa filosa]|uniref:Uncharacterized protein n=1 Tax=Reticulomyxa filosa TaxID=46433 RepID=X6P2Y9_RETFI|nr:hypothetical protein RFI_04614 [Reticulomyxa filosa]|eukprot:ETO32498.1 hypothetical protein RFI_04614 [Reticulomyxa filosa]